MTAIFTFSQDCQTHGPAGLHGLHLLVPDRALRSHVLLRGSPHLARAG